MSVSRPNNEAIFHAARDIVDADRRREYVREACGGDEPRISLIEAMLTAAEKPDSLLDGPAVSPPEATISQPMTHSSGATIGPYKFIEQIGEGGMGTVWMAQQSEPVKRLVAVKLIKAGMDSRQVIARFEAERQALALMDHTNIARVLDAGTTPAGRPYFVMELVRGVPITRYCDEHHLTPRQRLELFIPVCQAIQHAHQKGIIHRDLKPNNVLVAPYDGKPVPKVIDFGVAKATGQSLTDKTLVTGFGNIVGTLEYMSPEQAETKQLDIDTRSDIYSLGVLLYELLTGSTPFSRKDLDQAGMLELLRIIREEEPSKPSTKLSTAEGLPTLAANRGTEPAKLTKLVRGELDWIAMKALEKDRGRRYETASGFARDVQRYLNDEQVLACPPSAAYRFRKFARRNKTGLAVAGLVLFFLVLIAVGSLVAALQLDQTNTQLTTRNQELTKARQVADARLYQADLERARAQRWSRRPGQRFVALKALSEAVSLLPSLAISEEERVLRRRLLRDEAVACMTLVDVQLEREFEFNPPVDHNVVCDRQMTRYAVSDRKGNIRVHRLAEDDVVLRFPTFGLVSYQMEFSPDGRYLLAKYDQNTDAQLHVFDLRDGRTAWTVTDLPQGPSVAISHDSRLVSIGQTDRSIRLIELPTGQEQRRLPAAEAAPGALAFSPDGTMLAAVSHVHFGGPVIVWDLERSAVAQSLAEANGGTSVAWSPDGQWLAVGCADYCAYVWKAGQTGEPLAVCRGHQAEVIEVCFSNGGDLLATHSWDGTTRLWDSRTGRERLSVPGRGAARLRFGPNDRRMALARGVWQLAAGHECRTIPAHEQLGKDKGPGHAVVSPDDRLIASCDKDGLRLWDLAKRREIAHLPIGQLRSAHFVDSKSLITSGDHGLDRWPIRYQADQAGRLVIGPSQSLVSRWSSAHGSLSRDGRTLAVMSGTNVELLNLEANTPPRRLSGRAGLTRVALSPDGRWAAAGSWHGRGVRLWDADTGLVVKDWLMEFPNTCVAFSPDGRWLVTGTGQEFRFWRVGNWEAGKVIPRPPDDGNMPGLVAFSPDGRLLAMAKSRSVIQLVDPETGEPLATLESPEATQDWHSQCFNSGGSTLVAASPNHRLQIWDLGEIRRQLRAINLDWGEPPAQPRPDYADESGKASPEVAWQVEIIKSDVKHARTVYDEASALRSQGKLDEAIAALEDVILHLPNDADVHFKLASFLAESKQWDRSASLYAVALQRFGAPLWPGPWYEAIHSDEVFTRLTALRPEDRLPWILRARLHVLRGDWNRATADYARLNESLATRESSDLVGEADDLFGNACLLLLLADHPGYEQFCKSWADRVGEAPGWEYSLARAWGVSPRPVVPPPQIVERATKPVQAGRTPWHLHVLSLAHYRNGQFDQAIEHANESNAGSWRGGATALNWLVLAMAHHRLGDVEQARTSLEQARLLVGPAIPEQPLKVKWPNLAPPDVLEFELLRREAEDQIDPMPPENPTTEVHPFSR